LMGIGPLARWKKANLPDIATRLRSALAASLVAALAIPFAMGRWSVPVALGMMLAAWVAASGGVQLYERVRNAAGGTSAWARRRSERHRLGGARAPQALRRLDLGRVPPHGARRRAGRERPALPPGGEATAGAIRCRADAMTMTRYAIPIAIFVALVALLGVG